MEATARRRPGGVGDLAGERHRQMAGAIRVGDLDLSTSELMLADEAPV